MKVAGHQPYFFPYIGYFMLIKHSDKFIIFDTPQFIKGGWINRNRILNHNGDPRYINVTLEKTSFRTPICEIKIKDRSNWTARILKQVRVYENKAPYYKEVVEFLKECFKYDTDNLSELNTYTLKETCKYLRINHDIKVFSKMKIDVKKVRAPDEWALNIAKAMGINKCLNASGAMEIYDRQKYIDKDVELKFLKANLKPYRQIGKKFVAGLSIIDVMMFNSPEEINLMLDDYQIL